MFLKKLSQLLQQRVLRSDLNLVNFPSNVARCEVFRGAISMEEQERIHMEWWEVLEKEGQQQIEGSSAENKVVKNSFLEIYGEKNFTEVRSSQKKEISRLPGLTWSPTMMRILEERLMPIVRERQLWWMQKIPFEKRSGENCTSNSKLLPSPSLTSKNLIPDMGRVVEHSLPGYEMHVEHPTVGSFFLYLNMLSDTVLVFDDESTGRQGNVYLPAGSAMYVAEEVRWGFRFGEVAEPYHTFITPLGIRRRIETDLRLSIQLWKFQPGLLGYDSLQNRLDDALDVVEKRLDRIEGEELRRSEKHRNDEVEKLKDTREAIEALRSTKQTPFADVYKGNSVTGATMPTVSSGLCSTTPLSGDLRGSGLLGGDLPDARPPETTSLSAESLLKNVKGDFNVHRTQFTKIQGVLEEMKLMQSKGQPVDEMWMKKKISENNVEDAERDAKEGYDPNDVEGSWDRVDGKAKFYKSKLRSMDYDGTAFLHSRMPDISKEAPLDMKGTITKIAPYVRGGEKMLNNLPQG